MSIFNITILVLLTVTGGLSALYYLRYKSPRRAFVLLSLRLGTLLLIGLLFLQPKLKFSRLLPEHKRTAVLVDVSSSMNLFNTDSVMSRVTHLIDSVGGRTFTSHAMPVFVFGDSLRALTNRSSLGYEDRFSRFPSNLAAPALQNAANILIISDGNWSNFEQLSSLLQNKNVRYIPLEMNRYEPFTSQGAEIQPLRTTTGSSANAAIRLNGYRATKDTIRVSVTSATFSADTSIAVDSGFFDDSLYVPVPTSEPGTRLYKISSHSVTDSFPAVSYSKHEVATEKMRVAFADDIPSLDKRFLGLALGGHKELEIVSVSELREGDLALFFRWNQKNRQLFASLPPSISTALIGDVPCLNKSEIPGKNVSVETESAYEAEFGTRIRVLPPLVRLLHCPSPPPRSTIISARAENGNRRPLLYETVVSNRRIMVLSAQGVWRWDFWPAANIQSNFNDRFSTFLIKRLLSFARRNANRSFFAYPERTPVSETDSIGWQLSIPAPVQMQSEAISVRLRFAGQDIKFDSTYAIEHYGAASVRINHPPLQTGSYHYRVSLEADTGTMVYHDTLYVLTDNNEMRVHGLNKRILEQIAAPVAIRDTDELMSFLSGKNAADITVTQSFAVRRSWPTLVILLTLLCLEWLFRRLWRFD